MTDLEFKKLQQAQLEIMDEVHRLCEENGIAYYLIAGSALGAVRHGGFIPWDMDIDVGMRRAEYDRFREACLTGLSERFVYRDFQNTSGYSRPHALICIKNTRLASRFDKFNPGQENYGISLDIFPLDNAPATQDLQERHKKAVLFVKRALYRKKAECFQRAPLKNFIKKAVSCLMLFTTQDKLNRRLDEVLRRHDGEETGFIGSFTSPYRYEKECMPAAVYGKPTPVSFEGRTFYIPEQADAYLTQLYGNYMEIPSEEKRAESRTYFEEVLFDR